MNRTTDEDKMLHLSLLLAGIAALAMTDKYSAQIHVPRNEQGTVTGFSPIEGVEAFLGVPFAQPPVGELRFKPPQAFTSSFYEERSINATKFGPLCYQFHRTTPLNAENLAEMSSQSEDCLNLNIWRPAGTSCDDDLPVMIWIYGGAFR